MAGLRVVRVPVCMSPLTIVRLYISEKFAALESSALIPPTFLSGTFTIFCSPSGPIGKAIPSLSAASILLNLKTKLKSSTASPSLSI